MKKIFAFLLAVCLSFSVMSCGNGTASGAAEADSTVVATDTVENVAVDSTVVDSVVVAE